MRNLADAEGQFAVKPRHHGAAPVAENDFKGGIHAALGSLVGIMCAYNLMRWCAVRGTRHGVNTALYGSLWAFEVYQTWLHWRATPAVPPQRARAAVPWRTARSEGHVRGPSNVRQSYQVDLHIGDPDLYKGATDGQGNANAEGALDEQGLPIDEVAIAEDVLGANIDKTQG